MRSHETKLTLSARWANWLQPGVLAIMCLLVLGTSGCVTEPELKTDTNVANGDIQEQLGLGIVMGTSGYQEVQKDLALPGPEAQVIKGQVIKIEGAAYVVQDMSEDEQRIPVDQNTTIDRPAHVGDWIEAFLDEGGRAVHIQNIDKKIKRKQGP